MGSVIALLNQRSPSGVTEAQEHVAKESAESLAAVHRQGGDCWLATRQRVGIIGLAVRYPSEPDHKLKDAIAGTFIASLRQKWFQDRFTRHCNDAAKVTCLDLICLDPVKRKVGSRVDDISPVIAIDIACNSWTCFELPGRARFTVRAPPANATIERTSHQIARALYSRCPSL